MAAVEHGEASWIEPATFGLGIDGYEDAAIIGRGGNAVVYRARQRAFNRAVAVKVLSGADRDQGALHRFDRERAAIGTVSGHPNIVTVYDSGFTVAQVPFIAMEYLARGTLSDVIERCGALSWQSVVPVGVKLAGALESAHRFGILHRDIKPENVLVSNFGEPKLADFGIAHVLGGDQSWSSSGVQMSVLHAPPEVVDAQPATEASDIYSLASTLFTLVWGRPPFLETDHDSLVGLLIRVATAPIPDLTQCGAPPELQAVIERAMAKDPRTRYQSALEFGEALQAIEWTSGVGATLLPLENSGVHVPIGPVLPPTTNGNGGGNGHGPLNGHATSVGRTEPEPARVRFDAPDETPRAGSSGRLPLVCLAVALALVLIAAAVAGLLGRGSPPPESATSQATTVGSGSPLPAKLGALPAGAYHPEVFGSDLRFRLGSGWNLVSTESPSSIELENAAVPSSRLAFYLVDQAVSIGWTPGRTPERRRPEPDLAGWLRQNGRLAVEPGSPPVADGGAAAEFTVIHGYPYTAAGGANRCASTQCVLLFRRVGGSSPVAAFKGDRTRFYQFPSGDNRLLVTVAAPAQDFDRVASAASAVLASANLVPA